MKRLTICLFSIGWLIPAWLGVNTIMSFLNTEVWPLLRGEHPLNSFPFIDFSARCFEIAFLWLAAVVFNWSWQITARFQNERADRPTAGANAPE